MVVRRGARSPGGHRRQGTPSGLHHFKLRSMAIADRLVALGIELPPPSPPAGNYVPCVIDAGLLTWAATGRSQVARRCGARSVAISRSSRVVSRHE